MNNRVTCIINKHSKVGISFEVLAFTQQPMLLTKDTFTSGHRLQRIHLTYFLSRYAGLTLYNLGNVGRFQKSFFEKNSCSSYPKQ